MNEKEDYLAAHCGRVGADRMALGLSSVPDRVVGDLNEVRRLRKALEQIRDLDYRGNRHEAATIAYEALK